MSVSRISGNIIRGCEFTACPNQPVFINANDIYLLMPIFRKDQCGHWVDAMGEYSLCMNKEQTHYKFVSCLDECEVFLYRFIPGNWFAKRQGVQTGKKAPKPSPPC